MQIKFDKILGCLRELDEGTGGGGGTGHTIITGTVTTYAALPLASGYTGKYYIVDTATGTWILGTLKKSGLYKSNGTTWVYIDNVPETTSLSDGTTVITGTNIILEGTNGVVTTTDVNNNKIIISGPNVPDQLSDLSDDSTHRLVTDTEKTTWNNKLDSYTETDPVFLASQANNITSTHITTLNNTSGTNTGDETQESIIQKIGFTPLAPNGNGSQLTNLSASNISYTGFTTLNLYETNVTKTLSQGVATQYKWTSGIYDDVLSEYTSSDGIFKPKQRGVYNIYFTANVNGGTNTYSDIIDGIINVNGQWTASRARDTTFDIGITTYIPENTPVSFLINTASFSATQVLRALVRISRIR